MCIRDRRIELLQIGGRDLLRRLQQRIADRLPEHLVGDVNGGIIGLGRLDLRPFRRGFLLRLRLRYTAEEGDRRPIKIGPKRGEKVRNIGIISRRGIFLVSNFLFLYLRRGGAVLHALSLIHI